MIYSIEIEEERTGVIMVTAKSLREARKRAAEMFNDDPEHCVDWYDSEATFDGMTEEDMIYDERLGGCTDYWNKDLEDTIDSCLFCKDTIPEGRMFFTSCEAKGGEQNGRSAHRMEQRKPQPGGLAGRFGRRISRLFGRRTL